MSLHIYSIPHLHELKKHIKNNICNIPIKFAAPAASFAMAENFKNELVVNSWYICREVLHDNYPISNHLFLTHKTDEFSNLAKYIESLENKLNIEKHSVVIKTVRKNCVCIMFSEFWKNRLRFSLLTMILRFAVENKKQNFCLTDFNKCKYLGETLPALDLFFSGKIVYKGRKSSWYEQFQYLNLEESAKYLG
jgi:hypothetical protein